MTAASDPQRWRRLSKLFDLAVDLDPAARRILLEVECVDDPRMRTELERMLAADSVPHALDHGAADFVPLDQPVHESNDDDARQSIGTHLGPWVLERVLGRGGMGTVYAARRDDRDTLQRAAIKRLHRRWDGSLQAQRFLQERRILASLSHPGLPHLIDHGMDQDQRPWFALELVEGQSLIEWADANQLDLRARLQLFRQVCAAVQYAHQHFVVHRDLKPDNILVDSEGHPKVLDFGVAKRMNEADRATRTGAFAGFTPEYAAPEQISGGVVSAATDVYALGVVLYQLLSACLPYHVDQGNLHAATEAITSRTAERMERALTTGTPEQVAARLALRNTTTQAFRRFVRGDLTRIVQTALAKEPQRRYPSVQDFSLDLQRFLEGRTVSVSGDTVLYRSGKFVRRNGIAVGVVAACALALVGSTLHALQQARAEQQQRLRAETTLTFMRDIFAANTPDSTEGATLTAAELLDRAGTRIDGYFPDDPLARAQLLGELGDVYSSMTLHDKAIPFLAKAVDLMRGLRAAHPDLYAGRVIQLAEAYAETYDYEKVIALADRELPLLRGVMAGEEPAEAQLLATRATALAESGRSAQAERDLRYAILLYEKASAGGTASYAQMSSVLGYILMDSGRLHEALEQFQRARLLVEKAPGSTRLQKLVAQFSVGLAHSRLGDYTQAIPMLAGVLPNYEQLLGDASNRTMITRSQLAQAYSADGQYTKALALIDRNLKLAAQSGIEDPRDRIEIGLVKAKILSYMQRAGEADELVAEAAAYLQARMSEPSFSRGRMQWIIGETLLQQGHCEAAATPLEMALDDAVATSANPLNPNAGEASDSLGRCLMQAGEFGAALRRFDQGVAAFQAELGDRHPRTLRSKLHREWALAMSTRDPAVLAGMEADRALLVAVLGTERKPVVWQLDLMVDEVAEALGAPRQHVQRVARAKAGLAALAGTSRAHRFRGLNSFS
ncbi:MAG: serine/threonine-protein kinase [Pseudoxanthomonas sp.]